LFALPAQTSIMPQPSPAGYIQASEQLTAVKPWMAD